MISAEKGRSWAPAATSRLMAGALRVSYLALEVGGNLGQRRPSPTPCVSALHGIAAILAGACGPGIPLTSVVDRPNIRATARSVPRSRLSLRAIGLPARRECASDPR